ncbi:MAG: hypothetical protein HZA04_08605 [Nitrospinae bacterium]|nr:hypothetical protein [Nitrospinota bacterium]
MTSTDTIAAHDDRVIATHGHRREPRYRLPQPGFKGHLIALPGPMAIPVGFDNISISGAGISLLSPLIADHEKALLYLFKQAKKGNYIPVQLIFNGTKIPIHILNIPEKGKYGLRISENPILAALANKGKQVFHAIVQGAIRFDAPEEPFRDHPIVAREALCEDIRLSVENESFPSRFGFALAKALPALLPSLEGRVEDLKEALRLTGLFLKFMETPEKDLPLIVGAELHRLRRTAGEAPLDSLLPEAVRNLCDSGGFFASRDERAELEVLFESRHFSKRLPAEFGQLPQKHPVAELINIRFDSFTGQIFFLQSLVPYARLHYLNRFISPASEMAAMAGKDERLSKILFLRWVQNALNERATGGQMGKVGKIGDHFKQAMYEYILARKGNKISSAEIYELFDGKLPDQYRAIREKFLTEVCRLIDAPVRKRFEEYKTDTDEERSKTDAAKKEELQIQRMTPVELTKRFLWPKIVQMGIILPLHREIARTWIPADKSSSISELGNAVILSQSAYEEFLATACLGSGHKMDPVELFDVVDLQNIYKRTVDQGGKIKKGILAIHVDTMQPAERRELVLSKAILSPQWSKFYILNKPPSYFSKVFGKKTNIMNSLILNNMLTIIPTGEYV